MLRDLEIMMAAGHPNREAEKHLKDGATVFSDLEERFDNYMTEWDFEPDEIEEMRKMVFEKIAPPDWDCVKVDGKWYYIMYCL